MFELYVTVPCPYCSIVLNAIEQLQLKNIEIIINLFNDEKVPIVVHTGDITNANSLEQFSKLNSELIGVYGNNDRYESGLEEVAQKNNFKFQDPPKRLKLLDREIVIFHEPDKIDQFVSENKLIQVVLYGHTHRYENNTKNGVLYFNPGESVKDRAALFIVKDAINRKLISKGGTIVEGTAGNTGIGLAIVCKVYDLKLKIVIPKTQSIEKKNTLKKLGAELIEVDAVPYSNPKNYISCI